MRKQLDCQGASGDIGKISLDDNVPYFYIGKYRLTIYPDGIYIKQANGKREGEGMKCSIGMFEMVIDEFYKENF